MADDPNQNQATKGATTTGTGSAGAATTQAQDDDKFAIPQTVKDKYPDLVDLIKKTESMNDDEREYWFQILPIMTDEQITKFRGILINEKEQLAKLDTEYEKELTKLNEKHLIEWQEFEANERRKKLQKAESKEENKEQAEEAALLNKLAEI